jgi:hypothetical protein
VRLTRKDLVRLLLLWLGGIDLRLTMLAVPPLIPLIHRDLHLDEKAFGAPVSLPIRARLHDFGIFGGSNGYWKARLLHETRMYAFMPTEDIDSSLRALLDGHRIASDPFLVSRELAPVTVRALWNQRMRWAQGWFQVSTPRSRT